MSDSEPTPSGPPRAQVQPRAPFQWIWLIPIVAACIAAYLGFQAVAERGPTITVTFRTGDGMVAGQTKVRHKAVELGTVDSIRLNHDMTAVVVRIKMRRDASAELTEHARLWVVRPRLNAGNISGLDTLVSGSYIELDPGEPDGKEQLDFKGLEEPPAVRSDEPGTTFLLKSSRIGSLSSGSPIFYRDIDVGEVLNYDLGPNGDSVTVHAFIRAPYDKFVHEATHFWNASGLQLDLGAQGVRLRVESLLAVLNGGVAFDTSTDGLDTEVAKGDAPFELFSSEADADNAGYKQRIPFLVYFEGSVRGLSVGSPVELYGLQIGRVTDIRLQFDPTGATSRVAVRLEVTPERIIPDKLPDPTLTTPLEVARKLVQRGMRATLTTASYLTGQMVLSMQYFPNAAAADVTMEGDAIVLPSEMGGLGSITASISEVANKLGHLPLDQIARNLNATLANVSQLTNAPELKQTLATMAGAMASVQDLVRKVDAEATPALRRLPEIAQGLQSTVDRANRLVGSADTGYGENSQFRRDLQRLLAQVSDTARSVRLLADYLDQHPEALIRGRTDRAGEK